MLKRQAGSCQKDCVSCGDGKMMWGYCSGKDSVDRGMYEEGEAE